MKGLLKEGGMLGLVEGVIAKYGLQAGKRGRTAGIAEGRLGELP